MFARKYPEGKIILASDANMSSTHFDGVLRGRSVRSIKTATGALARVPADILEAWALHWASLCSDDGEFSRGRNEEWDQVFASRKARYRREIGSVSSSALTYREFTTAFHRQGNNKGAGPSGAAAEIYKACLPSLSRIKTATEAGRLLNRAISCLERYLTSSQMLEHGVVPRNMEISQVIALFKKGDRSEPGNYRGISLIEILLKVITDIVIKRVYTHLEEAATNSRYRTGWVPSETRSCSTTCGSLQVLQTSLFSW
jgi:hypothetical protein